MSQLVCYCFRVDKARIVSAIEEGCLSVDALGVRLRAGTGCGGCRPDLEDLVRFHGEEVQKVQEVRLPKPPALP